MSYDFHITRAAAWFDSEQFPISLEEWESFARGHRSLETDDGMSHSNVGMQDIFVLKGESGRDVTFGWHESRVVVTGIYSVETVRACVVLAEELQANLLGDEGEKYLPDGSESTE
ncbi:hypothetical protein ACFHW2_43245 [Actinomadura sp. LOL_016]|uniref:hypothetical protein n=1 Tax=unclassified Actinomadura TaxID=2626254 RepID=UPI003A804AFD